MTSNPQSKNPARPTRRTAMGLAIASVSAGLAKPVAAHQNISRNLAAFLATSHSSEDTNLKRRARDDYRTSMARFGGKLSNSPEELFFTSTQDPFLQFDILIVGSGYGAAMMASRLAPQLGSGRRIAIIERGREWIPGEFKDTVHGLLDETRGQLVGDQKRAVVNPLGLHNVIMNDEINVWTGNGLGGGSLINANIALLPDPEVFSKFKWPRELSDRRVLHHYYQQAASGLNLSRTPWDMTSKVRSRREAADQLRPAPGFFDLSPLSVMYDGRWLDADSANPQQIRQRPCTLCGDCITGCNVGAKNTLTMNYLPVAKSFGTEIYTQTEVRSIEKIDGMYRLELVYYDDRNCGVTRRYTTVWTRMLILGAGSPGSPALLLKSQEKGLCMSEALGHRWSGNGDTLGFVVRKQDCSDIGGVGAYDEVGNVGPTVQTSLNFRHRPVLEERYLIQEAAIPRGAKNLFRIILHDADLKNSGVMLGMGHDGAVGRVEIDENGRATIRWPGIKDAPFRRNMWEEFERIARAEGGEYKRLSVFGDNMVSVHPLGGCALADDPVDGVVNANGQVFDGTGGGYDDANGNPAVHHGLYVADGSIIPSSLGCNPFMTISALSLRIADGILADPLHRDLFV